MKKFTLMILFALVGVMSASAQWVDTLNLTKDSISTSRWYSLSDGTWSDGVTTTNGYSFYPTWTSNDKMLTITFEGYTYQFPSPNDMYYDIFPGSITFTCSEGMKLDSIWWQGWVQDDNMVIKNGDEIVATIDSAGNAYGSMFLGDIGTQTLTLSLEGKTTGANSEGLFQLYDDGSYGYAWITISGTTTLGIANVTADRSKANDNAWYTLSGQRVAEPGKGIYIRNGRKVIRR